MPTKIILKKSSVSGRIPDPGTLDYGELAINYTDGVLYYKNSLNIVDAISGGLDSDLVTQLVDSSYAAISANLIPSTDSTYDLGTPTKKWKELYLSGNTIHLGDAKLSTDANGNVEIKNNLGQLKKLIVDEIEVGSGANKVKLVGNNGKLKVKDDIDADAATDLSQNTTTNLAEGTNKYYTDARVSNLINSNYIQARQIRGADSGWVTDQINDLIDAAPGALDTLAELSSAIGDDANFSTTVTNLIASMPDSAYVASYVSSQLPRVGVDYPDSAWVSSRGYITDYTVTQSDVTTHQAALSITESQISDFGTYATTSSLAAVATSGAYSDISGVPTNISTFTNDAGYITNVSAADSAYIQSRQITYNTSDFLDSSSVELVVDDAYIQSKQITYNTSNFLDSSTVSLVVDAAYVQARQTAQDFAYSSLIGTPAIPDNPAITTDGSTPSLADGINAEEVRNLIGAVSSVGLSVPTGLSIANSPITSTGTLDITFASGYSLPATASQAQWNTAYGWGNHASAGYLTSETTTSLSLAANTLTYTDEAGFNTNIDLSLYLDDTNLARITSGNIDSAGLATFTRDDASTFTIDFSVLLDDTNLTRITNAAFNTTNGIITLTRNDSTTVTVDLDGRYLLADSAFSGSYTDLSNKPTLFSGSYTDLSNKPTLFDGAYSSLTGTPTNISSFTNDASYITGYTVTQSDVTTHQSAISITESQISDLGSYLTSAQVTSLVDSSYVNNRVTLTNAQISSVVDSDYILSRSTSVEIYDAYDSFISRHQLKLKADTQNGHVVVIGQILVEDSQGANPTLRDVSFHSPLEETMISINTLKATVAASTDFADFQARIAAL